jgi:hypothetical protein
MLFAFMCILYIKYYYKNVKPSNSKSKPRDIRNVNDCIDILP